MSDTAAATLVEATTTETTTATTSTSSVEEVAPETPVTPTEVPAATKPKTYSLTEAAKWLGSVLNDGVLVTPADLQTIYTLITWQFLHAHHVPLTGNLAEVPKLESVGDIKVTEQELARIVTLCMYGPYRSIFSQLARS